MSGGHGGGTIAASSPPRQNGCSPLTGGGPRTEEDEDDDDDEEDSSGEDYTESDCSSCSRDRSQDPDGQERKHFLDVCYSFLDYTNDAMHEVDILQDSLKELDAHDRALWRVDSETWLAEIRRRVEVNSRFLTSLPIADICAAHLGPEADRIISEVPKSHRVASRNASKVRSTLRQMVRDWAVEGEAERAASFSPLIDALLRNLPPGEGVAPRVLCPGCGLGRLPFDLARCGYNSQGNEFSYHMLMGSHRILARCDGPFSYEIFPFVLCTTNRRGSNDHLRAVRVPDLSTRMRLPPNAGMSMTAGEFVEVYKDQHETWDGMATCFFLDTAKNVFLYIRMIAQLMRPGGIWTNIGPLLFHYAEVPNEVSIELSWEEVKAAIARYFDFIEERTHLSQYAMNPGSLMGVKYRCVFFVVRRNSTPPAGVSNPVFG
mmetsp:Transcript_18584/g.41713  ORF Transcript_18584/g.41713 Transcript_18584/m.41713 type:complete len:431 (-) Transcript_18584:92-1384(-)